MAVTQKQIAEALGMSRSLVGEALSGHPKIAEPTRQKVLEMARQMGYDAQSNQAARSLIASRYGQRVRTRVIGLVLGSTNTLGHHVGAFMFPAIHQAVRSQDYDVLVLGRDRLGGTVPGADLAGDARCDGFILVNFTQLRPVLETLAEAGIPALTCLANDNPAAVPSIMPDNREAMRLAVEYLVRAGHRHIGHLAGPQDHSDSQERRAGFERAMREHGLACSEANFVQGHWGGVMTEIAAEAAQRDFTAFVCSNDGQALELWNAIEATGRSVPRDVSIVGMDDFGPAEARGLTTIANPLAEIGRLAVESMLALLEGADPAALGRTVPVQLVERRSVAEYGGSHLD